MHTPTLLARPVRTWLVVLSGLLAAAFGSARLSAQQSGRPAIVWPVDSVLVRFASERRANLPSTVVFDVLELPRGYAARQDSLLDGLERLAHRRERYVASAAAGMIAYAGQAGAERSPLPGVMTRLARIYRSEPALDPAGVRLAIRDLLPLQADRRAAVALLREIAAEPDERGPDPVHGYFSIGDPRIEALARLAEMGEDGRAALQALHRDGGARSPQARLMLQQLAQRGFPVTDLRRRRVTP